VSERSESSHVIVAIRDGEHLAIVGPSGAGKSTLARLIVGLLQPQEGVVLLGGRPAPTIEPRHRVLVPQQAYVFRGTLGENLLYLCPSAPPDLIDRAIDATGLRDLVDRLGGPGAEIDPRCLSAGERQLIALARAYLSAARLVVLDEATCHLDPMAEGSFAARDGTLVVVAHRISSARRAERILVVDGAEPLVGDHDQLVERSPLYRDLVGHWLDPELLTMPCPANL
jgi:ATP-binding cassette subfamily C protein